MGRPAVFPHGGDGHLYLKHDEVARFISAVGRDEDGYKALYAGQQEYTVSALKAYQNPDYRVAEAINTAATVDGLLDQGRIHQIEHDYGDKTDAANQALANSANWKKSFIGEAVGAGVGLATLPVEGLALPAVAAFAIPSIIKGAGNSVETAYGNQIDTAVQQQQADFDQQQEMTKAKFLKQSHSGAALPLSAYVSAHPELQNTDWYQELHRQVGDSYTSGYTLGREGSAG